MGLWYRRKEKSNQGGMVKKFIIATCALAALASVAFGGTETYSGKQAVVQPAPPCPEWYRDTEWNVSLWGTYLFTGSNWRDDQYLGVDHAWGGGGDVKFFFHRYFGIGLEGYAVGLGNNRSRSFTVGGETFDIEAGNQSVVGSVLGTFTFRYPIPCSRFAPYALVGGGAIFGGGSRSILVFDSDGDLIAERHNETESKVVGQFGGGFEVRFTPTIGWMNDFSWNVVDGSKNNFGMVRSGVTFAF
jgi:hypothetical protein